MSDNEFEHMDEDLEHMSEEEILKHFQVGPTDEDIATEAEEAKFDDEGQRRVLQKLKYDDEQIWLIDIIESMNKATHNKKDKNNE